MSRVIHVRMHGLAAGDREAVQARFSELAQSRDWRGETPWLADADSEDLFPQLYFADQRAASAIADPEAGPLSAATFIKVLGDETDALAILFIFRDLSERFGLRVIFADPGNPIQKLRSVTMDRGRLPAENGEPSKPLESILVRRSIFKRLSPSTRLELFPPQALPRAFGTLDGEDGERRGWSFLLAGMRGTGADFFEAEAEAMRIWRGLSSLGHAL